MTSITLKNWKSFDSPSLNINHAKKKLNNNKAYKKYLKNVDIQNLRTEVNAEYKLCYKIFLAKYMYLYRYQNNLNTYVATITYILHKYL